MCTLAVELLHNVDAGLRRLEIRGPWRGACLRVSSIGGARIFNRLYYP